MADIATELGLAKSTVSMALSHHPEIAPATRRKVEKTAESLGYKPDPALSRLAKTRWHSEAHSTREAIALVVWDENDYPDQLKDLSAIAGKITDNFGYRLETFFRSRFRTRAALTKVLRSRGIRGIIAFCSRHDSAWEDFPWEHFCAVEIFSGSGRATGMDNIRMDAFGDMIKAGLMVEEQRPRSAAICLIDQRRPSLTDDRYLSAGLFLASKWKKAGVKMESPV